MVRTFTDGFFSMEKEVWRSEISLLFFTVFLGAPRIQASLKSLALLCRVNIIVVQDYRYINNLIKNSVQYLPTMLMRMTKKW